MNSVANMALSSVMQVLSEVKYSFPAFLGLFHPHSLLETKGLLAELVGGDSITVLGTDSSHWKLIYSEFSDDFEKQRTLYDRAIRLEIDLLP